MCTSVGRRRGLPGRASRRFPTGQRRLTSQAPGRSTIARHVGWPALRGRPYNTFIPTLPFLTNTSIVDLREWIQRTTVAPLHVCAAHNSEAPSRLATSGKASTARVPASLTHHRELSRTTMSATRIMADATELPLPNLQVGDPDLLDGYLMPQMYQELHNATTSELVARGCTHIEVAGADALERWASVRRRHNPYGSRARPGHADGTALALAKAQGQTLICMQRHCGSFVHLQAARRHARAAGRMTFSAGDGCASKQCSRAHVQSGRLARRQAQMAAALLDGSRVLVLWPQTTEARIDLWAAPQALARAKAQQVHHSA